MSRCKKTGTAASYDFRTVKVRTTKDFDEGYFAEQQRKTAELMKGPAPKKSKGPLPDETVREVRKALKTMPACAVALKFNLSVSRVRDIDNGISYAHVKE